MDFCIFFMILDIGDILSRRYERAGSRNRLKRQNTHLIVKSYQFLGFPVRWAWLSIDGVIVSNSEVSRIEGICDFYLSNIDTFPFRPSLNTPAISERHKIFPGS